MNKDFEGLSLFLLTKLYRIPFVGFVLIYNKLNVSRLNIAMLGQTNKTFWISKMSSHAMNFELDIGVRRWITDYTANHVSTKFPRYFNKPVVWLSQIEAIFEISRVTRDEIKYLHLIANLPAEILLEYQENLSYLIHTSRLRRR